MMCHNGHKIAFECLVIMCDLKSFGYCSEGRLLVNRGVGVGVVAGLQSGGVA